MVILLFFWRRERLNDPCVYGPSSSPNLEEMRCVDFILKLCIALCQDNSTAALNREHHKVVWPFQNSHQSNLIKTSDLLFIRNSPTCLIGTERPGADNWVTSPTGGTEGWLPPEWVGLLHDFRGWDSAHKGYWIWLIRTRMWVKGLCGDIPQLCCCLYSWGL